MVFRVWYRSFFHLRWHCVLNRLFFKSIPTFHFFAISHKPQSCKPGTVSAARWLDLNFSDLRNV